MPRIEEQYAIAADGLDGVSLALGRNLLDAAGIPSLSHSPDFDMAELGRAAHDQIRGSVLLVPKSLGEKARAVLRAAWGDELVPPRMDSESSEPTSSPNE